MMYLHKSFCISPQKTHGEADLNTIFTNQGAWLQVQEPQLESIPRGVLRRMGKAVRLGVGCGLPLLESSKVGGIILGTANGGMEDCIKFLNQIIEYNEGSLTPTNFVQSTTNAIAGQLGLLSENTGYNATHVHRGLAFENALLDAAFFAQDNPNEQVLVGGLDEISTYNYNIDFLAGWYKKEEISNLELYNSTSKGSLAGEGAAMFLASANPKNALLKIEHIRTVHTTNEQILAEVLAEIRSEYNISTVMSGENGDARFNALYENLEEGVSANPSVFRYKHLCGEYPTSAAFALWLAMKAFEAKQIPAFLNMKKGDGKFIDGKWLIYNAYHGFQHSFIVVSPV